MCMDAAEECDRVFEWVSTSDGEYQYCKPFCDYYSYKGECVNSCPSGTFVSARNGSTCVDECESKIFWTAWRSLDTNRYCMETTDDNFFITKENVTVNGETVEYVHGVEKCENYVYDQVCVDECPDTTFVEWDGKKCVTACAKKRFFVFESGNKRYNRCLHPSHPCERPV